MRENAVIEIVLYVCLGLMLLGELAVWKERLKRWRQLQRWKRQSNYGAWYLCNQRKRKLLRFWRSWKRRLVLSAGMLFFLGVTMALPSGQESCLVEDLEDRQAVFVMERPNTRAVGCFLAWSTFLVIDKKGRSKSFGLSEAGEIYRQKTGKQAADFDEALHDIGVLEDAGVFDAAMESDKIPYQPGRICLTDRVIECALNQQEIARRGDVPVEGSAAWQIKQNWKERPSRQFLYSRYYFAVSGTEERKLRCIGCDGIGNDDGEKRNWIGLSPELLLQYTVFLQTDGMIREIFSKTLPELLLFLILTAVILLLFRENSPALTKLWWRKPYRQKRKHFNIILPVLLVVAAVFSVFYVRISFEQSELLDYFDPSGFGISALMGICCWREIFRWRRNTIQKSNERSVRARFVKGSIFLFCMGCLWFLFALCYLDGMYDGLLAVYGRLV